MSLFSSGDRAEIERESYAAVEQATSPAIEKRVWRVLIGRQGWRATHWRGRIVGFPPEPVQRLALWLLATVAVATAAAHYSAVEPLYFLVGGVGGVSVLVQLRRVPRPVALFSRAALYLLLVATAVFGFMRVVNPSLEDQVAFAIAQRLAVALSIGTAACLLGVTGAPAGGATLPACLGLLVVASFGSKDDLDLRDTLPFPLAFIVLWLVASAAGARVARGPREGIAARAVLGPAARTAGQVALAAAIALGIASALPRIQERIDKGLYDLAGRRSGRYSGFTHESRLGDLASLKTSDRIVMRVHTSTPQYLRGRVFSAFDGVTWKVKEGPKLALPEADPSLPIAPEIRDEVEEVGGVSFVVPARETLLAQGALPSAVVTRVVQTVFVLGTLVAPGQKVLVRAPVEGMKLDPFDNLEMLPVDAEVDIYATVNRPGIPDPSPPSAAHLAECAQVPARTDPRFLEMARAISGRSSTVEERIARTTEAVMRQCKYSLEPGEFRKGEKADPVAEFFFEKRKGYCQYFASAAAILLRAQGVPCRYVTGFAVTSDNWLGGHYVVREHDAHAWLEAYVEGRGWVEVDATPADELASLHGRVGRGPLDAAIEWVSATFQELAAFLRHADLRAVLARIGGAIASAARFLAFDPLGRLLTLGALAAAAAVALRRVRRRKGAASTERRPGPEDAQVPGRLARLLAEVDRALARAGRGRPASRAPLEHVRSLEAPAVPAELLRAARAIVEAYYAARFAGLPPSPGALDALEAEWREVRDLRPAAAASRR